MPGGGPGSPNGSFSNSDTLSLVSQPSNCSASSSTTLEACHLSHLGFPAPWHPTPPPADLRAPSRGLVHGSPSWTSTVPSPSSPGRSPTGEVSNGRQGGLGLEAWDATRYLWPKKDAKSLQSDQFQFCYAGRWVIVMLRSTLAEVDLSRTQLPAPVQRRTTLKAAHWQGVRIIIFKGGNTNIWKYLQDPTEREGFIDHGIPFTINLISAQVMQCNVLWPPPCWTIIKIHLYKVKSFSLMGKIDFDPFCI